MELVVKPEGKDYVRFWRVRDFSYDQGCVHILGRTYNCIDLVDMRLKPAQIERIWIILRDEEMKSEFRKQLADVFWSSNDDGHVLDIKVETHKTIVQRDSLLDWAKVN